MSSAGAAGSTVSQIDEVALQARRLDVVLGAERPDAGGLAAGFLALAADRYLLVLGQSARGCQPECGTDFVGVQRVAG
jgi:hypothetical protein